MINSQRRSKLTNFNQKDFEMPDEEAPNIFDAAGYGDVDDLEAAMQHWDINAQDENGMTPLHWAASRLNEKTRDRILQELDKGLDPFIKDNWGREASWVPIDVHGKGGAEFAIKITHAISPIAEEDLELYADDAPEL